MNETEKKEKKLTLKQRFLLFFYRLKQFIHNKLSFYRYKLLKFTDSFRFYLIIISVFSYGLSYFLVYINPIISKDHFYNLGFATAGIIGASIAIIFSFSTFILQSTADLFSTQYLNKFIENKKEKIFFWLLVLLTIISFLIPFFSRYKIEKESSYLANPWFLSFLIFILLLAFYLIYALYKELRERTNPETTLSIIKEDAINQLKLVNQKLLKQAKIQNNIFQYEGENKDYCLDIQYKSNQNRKSIILEDIKYLYEIGLRLLSKNEINSFNLTLKYIHDIYLKHLELRNNNFIRIPADFLGTYTFDDEWFTTTILEYLQSIEDRIITEKRKENIYFLFKIYQSIITFSLNIKFADKGLDSIKDNPLLSLVLAYYTGFIERLITAKEDDWVWESIKSLSNLSNTILTKTDSYLILSKINEISNKLLIPCIEKEQEAFLKEIISIYLNQIKIAWSKYGHNDVFWNDLFKELKKNILFLSIQNNLSLSTSDLFINFNTWQVAVINEIFNQDKEENEYIEKFLIFIEKWSDFLLDFARSIGLENKKIWLSIIQSVDNNLRIIYGIKSHFPNINLDKIYKTQFNIFSWYFQNTDKVEESLLFNLKNVLEILLVEVNSNLKKQSFEMKDVINLYVRLIEQHFEKCTIGYGYNHPRVIEKLIPLWLILEKYEKKDEASEIINKIGELNKKYLEINKDFFNMKKEKTNLMWPDEHQLCEEIHDLEKDIFWYNSYSFDITQNILRQEVTKKIWDSFITRIDHCKNIEYTTTSIF